MKKLKNRKNIWKCTNSIYGGNVSDQPKNLIRQFPGPEKRKVKVEIVSYLGLGCHFYPSMNIEANPAYNPEKDAWQVCWDDSDEIKGKHISLGEKFFSFSEARDFLQETFDKMFDPELYELDTHSLYDPQEDFSTYREGD